MNMVLTVVFTFLTQSLSLIFFKKKKKSFLFKNIFPGNKEQ